MAPQMGDGVIGEHYYSIYHSHPLGTVKKQRIHISIILLNL